LIITGHRKGLIKFWLKQIEKNAKTDQEKWSLFLVHQIIQQNNDDGNVDSSDVVDLAISTSKKLYSLDIDIDRFTRLCCLIQA
jgi:hypothetical protein